MAKNVKKAVKQTVFTKVCQDCGKKYKSQSERGQFCSDCKRHRAVLATQRNRLKNKANLAEMAKLNTPDDVYADIHLKVRRAVKMMEAGAAVVTALRNWMASCVFPEAVKNVEYDKLQTMLNCYALQERGV